MDLATVTVRVGEADIAVDITVYRYMLSAVSPYFRGAFEGSFIEATDRFISLTDVTEQTFRMLLQWAHTQKNELPSGGTVQPPGILLQEPMKNTADETGMNPAEIQPSKGTRNVPEAKITSGAASALDEASDSDNSMDFNFENPGWVNMYRLSLLSFLRLYIFADKYDVPQLRDDVLTALVAQSNTWGWWPDVERELIEFVYANLPPVSKFIRFLVMATAYVWLAQYGCCSASKVREIREMNEDFAFDVMVVQNSSIKGRLIVCRLNWRALCPMLASCTST